MNTGAAAAGLPVEHQATVDKGLKMKIKRKNVNKATVSETTKTDNTVSAGTDSVEVSPGKNSEQSLGASDPPVTGGASVERLKQALSDKDKVKGRAAPKKEKGKERKMNNVTDSVSDSMDNNSGVTVTQSGCRTDSGDKVHSSMDHTSASSPGKRPAASPAPDPYEFNARIEDRISLPMSKKMKTEKMDNQISPGATRGELTVDTNSTAVDTNTATVDTHTVAVDTNTVAVATEPDFLGPCDPGTHVILEGIVWNETQNGLLVINVTWRGKTYVGTLMDATRHDWAPPRLNDDPNTGGSDVPTPKGRGKKGRASAPTTPVGESCTVGERRLRKTRGRMVANNATAPTPSPGGKRKGRPADLDLAGDSGRGVKRGRGSSQPSTPTGTNQDGLIDCPETDCNKKYRHINGLRYHLTHTHKKTLLVDSEGNIETEVAQTIMPPPVNSAKVKLRRGVERNGYSNAFKTEPDVMDKKRLSDSGIKKPSVALTKLDVPMDIETKNGLNYGSVVDDHRNSELAEAMVSKGAKHVEKVDSELLAKAEPIEPSRLESSSEPAMSEHAGSVAPRTTFQEDPYTKPYPTAGIDASHKPGKDKKKKKKKDKDREKTAKDHQNTKDEKPNMSVIKCTSGAAIPIAAVPPTVAASDASAAGAESHEAASDTASINSRVCQNAPPELQKQDGASRALSGGDKTDGEAVSAASNGPPSNLSVNFSSGTPQAETEDLHSPAYSDISDAGEVAPTLPPPVASPANKPPASSTSRPAPIRTDDKAPADSRPTSTDSHSSIGHGFYPNYFGTPPHLPPALTPESRASPLQGSQVPSSYKNPAAIPMQSIDLQDSSASLVRSTLSPTLNGRNKELRNPKTGVVSHNSPNTTVSNSVDREKRVRSPSLHHSQTSSNKVPSSSSSSKDFPSQTQRLYSGASQYPNYTTPQGYGYGIDPAYHMHLMATNPDYRIRHEAEKLRKEEIRRRQEHSDKQKHESKNYPGTEFSDQKPVDMSSKRESSSSSSSSHHSSSLSRIESSQSQPSNREYRNVPKREYPDHPTGVSHKQPESRHLTEESAKHQVKGSPSSDRESRAVYERQQEDLQKFYLYQQKCYAQQQRYMQHHGVLSPANSSKNNKRLSGSSSTPGRESAPETPSSAAVRGSRESHGSDTHKDHSVERTPNSTSSQRSRDSSTPTTHPYPPQGYPQYPPYESPVDLYPSPYMHPSQIHFRHTSPSTADPLKSSKHPPSASPGLSKRPDDSKDTVTQNRASPYGSHSNHKIHELKEASKPDEGRGGTTTEGETKKTETSPAREDKSPPPQRHLHTHHHTHVVGAAYPLYPQYPPLMGSSQSSAVSPPGPPPFVPK